MCVCCAEKGVTCFIVECGAVYCIEVASIVATAVIWVGWVDGDCGYIIAAVEGPEAD
jgi:hypothetical protein